MLLKIKWMWLLFAIGLIVNLGILLYYHFPAQKTLIGDENHYAQQALLLASGQRSPYDLLWPPLYGEFIGLIFGMLGPRVLYVQIIQIGIWLLTALLFKNIVSKLSSSSTVVVITTALFLLSSELIAFSHYLWPETLHLFLWICSLWVLICRPLPQINTVLAGVLLGLALLTKSLLLPFVPVIAFFTFLLDPSRGIRQRLTNVILLAASISVVVLPVMTNNLLKRGEFVLSDSSVFNAWVGLTDVETADSVNDRTGSEVERFMQAGPNLQTRNAVYKAKIAQKIKQQGVHQLLVSQFRKQYFRLFDVQTFFTTQLAGGGRQAYKNTSGLLNTLLKTYSYTIYSVVLIAGAAGVCFLRIRPLGWHHFFFLFIAYNLALFLVLHVKTRYVLQFFPMLIFFAGITWHGLLHNKNPGHALPGFAFTTIRVWFAMCASVVMCYLVFYNLIWK